MKRLPYWLLYIGLTLIGLALLIGGPVWVFAR